VRRVGVLLNRAVDDPEGQALLAAFKTALEQFGWSDGRNIRFDIRWGEDDAERERKYAAELVELRPDVILASGSLGVTSLERITQSLPIVFAGLAIPSVPASWKRWRTFRFRHQRSMSWSSILRPLSARPFSATVTAR
jgi:putative ABC transport system substrate-binding protein